MKTTGLGWAIMNMARSGAFKIGSYWANLVGPKQSQANLVEPKQSQANLVGPKSSQVRIRLNES